MMKANVLRLRIIHPPNTGLYSSPTEVRVLSGIFQWLLLRSVTPGANRLPFLNGCQCLGRSLWNFLTPRWWWSRFWVGAFITQGAIGEIFFQHDGLHIHRIIGEIPTVSLVVRMSLTAAWIWGRGSLWSTLTEVILSVKVSETDLSGIVDAANTIGQRLGWAQWLCTLHSFSPVSRWVGPSQYV